MKISQSIRSWGVALLMIFLMGAVSGCGSVKNEGKGGDGSMTTTVGGTSVVGGDRTINLTTNRNEIAVTDTALITVSITCTSSASADCITNSAGQLVFAAQPTEFQTGNGAPQKATNIIANYSISPAATLSQATDTLTLAAGTRADSTASPPKSVIPGATASEVIFSVTLTGAKTGSALFTAQSLDTIASLIVKVF